MLLIIYRWLYRITGKDKWLTRCINEMNRQIRNELKEFMED